MKIIDCLKHYYGIASQHPKIWIVLGVLLAVILLFWFPHWEVSRFGITNPKDLADAENSHRATMAQILGGIAIGGSLYYTWRRVTISEEELRTSKEGQITERFTRAVDQLGHEKMEVRLGGIYALERISMESARDYWPIIEILTAYVRKNSSFCEAKHKKLLPSHLDIQANEITISEVSEIKIPSIDIQAILTILGQCQESVFYKKNKKMDLRMTCLQNAVLNNSNFSRADFSWSNLKEANFTNSDLKSSVLIGIHLEGAFCSYANLKNAILYGAHLEGTEFINAHLEGSNLTEAHLEGASLFGAHLEESHLNNAYFYGADFQEANLDGAELLGTNLKCAKNLTVDQLSKVRTLYNAVLDEKLDVLLRDKFPRLFDKIEEEDLIVEMLENVKHSFKTNGTDEDILTIIKVY